MNEEILRNLNYRIDKALDYTRQWVESDDVAERLDDYKVKAEKFIVKNPVKSIAGGLIVGYLIGKILSDD